MIWLLLLLDVLIYNFTSYSTYFFLLSILITSKKDCVSIIILGLFLDFVVLSTPFVNTIILLLLFFLDKKFFKMQKRELKSFLLITNFNFVFYYFLLSALYSLDLSTFALTFLINLLFCLLSYNLLKKHIKLSR